MTTTTTKVDDDALLLPHTLSQIHKRPARLCRYPLVAALGQILQQLKPTGLENDLLVALVHAEVAQGP